MIRITSEQQLTLSGFKTPFNTELDQSNRWVRLSHCIPWDAWADAYYQSLCLTQGRPAKSARLVIGAVIIKHKLCLSDEETVQQIQENPYLQYFVGLPAYQTRAPFVPSLLVDVRCRMGSEIFEQFHQGIVDALQGKTGSGSTRSLAIDVQNDDDDGTDGESDSVNEAISVEANTHQGKLIVDATVVEQAICYPTDLSLLNEARQVSEALIDRLHLHIAGKKPRTYRRIARKAYLSIVKRCRPSAKVLRKGISKQLSYLRRNLGPIEQMLDATTEGVALLPPQQLRCYRVIQQVYDQQRRMFESGARCCDHRIVSLQQPHVRPIVRGKTGRSVEFGAKLSVSLDEHGLAHVDHLRWDAFNEGQDLIDQVEGYRQRYGHYPKKVLADPLYGSRENRRYLKEKGIHYAGKPLGRPRKRTLQNTQSLKQAKAQRQQDYRERIPIEGKFGQGKQGYQLNRIKAKTAHTSEAWIRSMFLVMNLLVLYQIFNAWCKFVLHTINHCVGSVQNSIKESLLTLMVIIRPVATVSF